MEINIGQDYRFGDDLLANVVAKTTHNGNTYIVFTYVDCYGSLTANAVLEQTFIKNWEKVLSQRTKM